MRPMRFALLTTAMTAGTMAAGWWTVAVIAAGWSLLTRSERAHHLTVATSAALSWALLLGVMSLRGPVARVSEILGGIIPVGTLGIFAVTLLFPALLAGSASVVTSALVRRLPADLPR